MTCRPPRPGDLIAVRTAEREHHGVLHRVFDDGLRLVLAASFGDHHFDVVVRRVGYPLESTVQFVSDIVDAFDAVKQKLDPVVHAEFEALKTAVEARFTAVEADLKAALDRLAELEKAAAPVVAEAVTEAEDAVEQVAADAVKGA